jgi:hypothetical protein
MLAEQSGTAATERASPQASSAPPPASAGGLSTQVFLSSFKVEEFGKQRVPSAAVPSAAETERKSTAPVRAEAVPGPATDMSSGHCREMCERILKEIGQLVEEW